MSDFEQVRQAKNLHHQMLLKRANVVGVGVGYKSSRGGANGEMSVVVLVRQKLPPAALSAEALVPPELTGVRTDVIEVGELRSLAHITLGGGASRTDSAGRPNNACRFTTRQRPAPAGVSLGHYQITAGTLGCVVHERGSGRRLILSNNHVLANINRARPGDPILQPAPADGGQVGPDTLAVLERFIPLRFNIQPASCGVAEAYARLGNLVARLARSEHQIQALKLLPGAVNQVDAALARPIDEEDVLERALEIGPLCGVQSPALGMSVCKAGRTTAFTSGVIQVLDASVVVNYGPGQQAAFEGQVISTSMSDGGDSGSLIASSAGHQAVGLLFAGSPQATIFTPIQIVLDAMQVDLPGGSATTHALPGTSTRPTTTEPAVNPATDHAQAIRRAQAIQQTHEARLRSKANVVGVGVGLRYRGGQPTDQVALVVLVERKLPPEQLSPEDLLPSKIGGLPVDVKQVGRVITR